MSSLTNLLICAYVVGTIVFWLNISFSHPRNAIFSLTIIPIFFLGMCLNIWLVDAFAPELMQRLQDAQIEDARKVAEGLRVRATSKAEGPLAFVISTPLAFIAAYFCYALFRAWEQRAKARSSRKELLPPNLTTRYIFVGLREMGPLKEAKLGERIRCTTLPDRSPPWIEVFDSIGALRLDSGWLGRILKVRVLDPVNDEDARMAGIEQPDPYQTRTLAIEIKIIEELPLSQLFGPHGDAVWGVIERARQLDLVTVEALAKAKHPDADKAYSRACASWLTIQHLGDAQAGDNFEKTRNISTTGARSPINEGLVAIQKATETCASDLVGDSAYVEMEIGVDIMVPVLEPRWSAACDALIHAAMAFGAPEFVNAQNRQILASAWMSVFGKAPAAPPWLSDPSAFAALCKEELESQENRRKFAKSRDTSSLSPDLLVQLGRELRRGDTQIGLVVLELDRSGEDSTLVDSQGNPIRVADAVERYFDYGSIYLRPFITLAAWPRKSSGASMICQYANLFNATVFAEMIRQRFETSFNSQAAPPKFTLSAGVATSFSDRVESEQQLLELATQRLMAAQQAGGNQVWKHNPDRSLADYLSEIANLPIPTEQQCRNFCNMMMMRNRSWAKFPLQPAGKFVFYLSPQPGFGYSALHQGEFKSPQEYHEQYGFLDFQCQLYAADFLHDLPKDLPDHSTPIHPYVFRCPDNLQQAAIHLVWVFNRDTLTSVKETDHPDKDLICRLFELRLAQQNTFHDTPAENKIAINKLYAKRKECEQSGSQFDLAHEIEAFPTLDMEKLRKDFALYDDLATRAIDKERIENEAYDLLNRREQERILNALDQLRNWLHEVKGSKDNVASFV